MSQKLSNKLGIKIKNIKIRRKIPYSQLLNQLQEDNQRKANKPRNKQNMLEKEQWWKKTITFNDLSQTKT